MPNFVLKKDLKQYAGPALEQINQEAYARRVRLLTPGVPYAEKAAEAFALAADPALQLPATPYLAAEAPATGVDLLDLAAIVRERSGDLAVRLATIEAWRRSAVERIKAASTRAEIIAALTEAFEA